jgi:uncharacterized membrane protein YjgN (DUF898 family)
MWWDVLSQSSCQEIAHSGSWSVHSCSMMGVLLARRSILMVSEAVHNFQGLLLLLLLLLLLNRWMAHSWNLKPGHITHSFRTVRFMFRTNVDFHSKFNSCFHRTKYVKHHIRKGSVVCYCLSMKTCSVYMCFWYACHLLVASVRSEAGSCTALCAVDHGMPSLW